MQVDPIGLKGGFDTYGYVNQNPLKHSNRDYLYNKISVNW